LLNSKLFIHFFLFFYFSGLAAAAAAGRLEKLSDPRHILAEIAP
jgi:hypothetical protein